MELKDILNRRRTQSHYRKEIHHAAPEPGLGHFHFLLLHRFAYADVKKLTTDEITTGFDGEKWIWTSRQKTDSATRIPLLPPALEIIDRHKDDPQCLNQGRVLLVLSNQKMHRYLKEIADACDIKKKMTFHTARHTFATTVTLTNGVPIETVGKMLGHRNLKDDSALCENPGFEGERRHEGFTL